MGRQPSPVDFVGEASLRSRGIGFSRSGPRHGELRRPATFIHRSAAPEALTRGPRGSPFESPEELFDEAYVSDRVAELDWACRAAAIRAAMEAGLPKSYTLFVNAEPASLRTNCPPDLIETIESGTRRLRVVLELTERDLTNDPAAVLEAVRVARANGLGIAIDDMGAEPASQAMMPLVRPDVVKLDRSLLQRGLSVVGAQTVNGILAEIERTGATVLAEGGSTTAMPFEIGRVPPDQAGDAPVAAVVE